MSENTPKGVKVTISVNTITRPEFHAGASVIEVADGHLYVKEAGPMKTVAIYAPGKWLHAVVSE